MYIYRGMYVNLKQLVVLMMKWLKGQDSCDCRSGVENNCRHLFGELLAWFFACHLYFLLMNANASASVVKIGK